VLWERNEGGGHYSLKEMEDNLYSKILHEHKNEIIENISKTLHLPKGNLGDMLKTVPL